MAKQIDRGNEDNKWVCTVCSFGNEAGSQKCFLCGAEAVAAKQQSVSLFFVADCYERNPREVDVFELKSDAELVQRLHSEFGGRDPLSLLYRSAYVPCTLSLARTIASGGMDGDANVQGARVVGIRFRRVSSDDEEKMLIEKVRDLYGLVQLQSAKLGPLPSKWSSEFDALRTLYAKPKPAEHAHVKSEESTSIERADQTSASSTMKERDTGRGSGVGNTRVKAEPEEAKSMDLQGDTLRDRPAKQEAVQGPTKRRRIGLDTAFLGDSEPSAAEEAERWTSWSADGKHGICSLCTDKDSMMSAVPMSCDRLMTHFGSVEHHAARQSFDNSNERVDSVHEQLQEYLEKKDQAEIEKIAAAVREEAQAAKRWADELRDRQQQVKEIWREKRSVEELERIRVPDKRVLFLTNVPADVSEADIRAQSACGQFGNILKVSFGRAGRVGFVVFATEASGVAALQALRRQGLMVRNNHLNVLAGQGRICRTLIRREACHDRDCCFVHVLPNSNSSSVNVDAAPEVEPAPGEVVDTARHRTGLGRRGIDILPAFQRVKVSQRVAERLSADDDCWFSCIVIVLGTISFDALAVRRIWLDLRLEYDWIRTSSSRAIPTLHQFCVSRPWSAKQCFLWLSGRSDVLAFGIARPGNTVYFRGNKSEVYESNRRAKETVSRLRQEYGHADCPAYFKWMSPTEIQNDGLSIAGVNNPPPHRENSKEHRRD